MTSLNLAGLLGLNSSTTTNLGPYYLIFHFLFSQVFISTRPAKHYFGIDHNVSPRADLATYGEAAVKKGRMTRAQLQAIERLGSAHANSMEHYPALVAGVVCAIMAGVKRYDVNWWCAFYTVSRVVFVVSYVLNDKVSWSYVRSSAWWASNIACIRLLMLAGNAMNT